MMNPPKTSHRIEFGLSFKTLTTFQMALSIICLTLLGVAFALRFPLITPKLMHQDCETFTHAAKLLAGGESLTAFGHPLPFQLLRESGLNQPFYQSSITAILMYVPLFWMFGASDFSFFLVQTLLVLAIFALFVSRLRSIPQALILLGLGSVLGTWNRSIFTAATTLPVIIIALAVWPNWGPRGETLWSKKYALITGALIGLGFTFRPEALFLLVILGAVRIRRQEVAILFCFVLSFIAILALNSVVRKTLGAASVDDSQFFNIGSSVFSPGLSTVGLPRSSPLSAMVLEPTYRKALVHKIFTSLLAAATLRSNVFSRLDSWLIWIAIAGNCFGLLPWRRYLPLAVLMAFYVFQAALVLDYQRYYDLFFTLLLVQLWIDLSPQFRKSARSPVLLLSMAWLLGLSAAVIWKEREIDIWNRSNYWGMINTVKTKIPSGSLVMSNEPQFWSWYLAEKKTSFVPFENPETLGLILHKFPDAYLVSYSGDQGLRGGVLEYADKHMKKIASTPTIYAAIYSGR